MFEGRRRVAAGGMLALLLSLALPTRGEDPLLARRDAGRAPPARLRRDDGRFVDAIRAPTSSASSGLPRSRSCFAPTA